MTTGAIAAAAAGGRGRGRARGGGRGSRGFVTNRGGKGSAAAAARILRRQQASGRALVDPAAAHGSSIADTAPELGATGEALRRVSSLFGLLVSSVA